MLLDLDQGKITEVDFLNGEIVRMGKQYGVKTPLNEKLVELVHQAEKEGRSPNYTPQQVNT